MAAAHELLWISGWRLIGLDRYFEKKRLEACTVLNNAPLLMLAARKLVVKDDVPKFTGRIYLCVMLQSP